METLEVRDEPETAVAKENNDPAKQDYRIGVFHGRAFFYIVKEGIHDGERDIPFDTRLEFSKVPEFFQKSFGIREGEVATLVKGNYDGRFFEFGTGEPKPRLYPVAGLASKSLIIRYAASQEIPTRFPVDETGEDTSSWKESMAAARRQRILKRQQQAAKRIAD